MYLKQNWIPLNSLLSDVYRMIDDNIISEEDIQEFAAQAMEHVTTHKFYEHALCIVDVENYRAQLPTGMKMLEFVMYRKTDCNLNDIEIIGTTSTTCEDCTPYDSNGARVYVKNAFVSFLQCQSCISNWAFLKMSFSPLDRIRSRFQVCDDSPSMGCVCVDTFSIDYSCHTLTTTFPTGKLLIAYRTYPRDNKGNFLIPDTAILKSAIETYVYMRYWQKRSFSLEQGANNMYQQYLKQWELLSTSSKVQQIMPDEYGYIELARNQKMMYVDSPYTVFTTHGVENIFLR